MTKHQAQRTEMVLAAIEAHVSTYGYAPSVRELCAGAGLSSTSAVYHHLQKLRASGRIHWDPATARSIVVIADPRDPTMCSRPGCDKALTGHQTRWCSASCTVIAGHVKRWLRACDATYLEPRLGL